MNNKLGSIYSRRVHLQNPFYRVHALIKQCVNKMRNAEFYEGVMILILGLALIITPIALSYITANITIQNSGKIITTKTLITQISEIRGVFLQEEVFSPGHNWTLIAKTCVDYGINSVYCNDFSTFTRRPDSEIRAAIDAFHAYGIEYHSVMSVLQDTRPSTSLGTEAIESDGSVYSVYSHCPIKAHDYVLSAIQNYLGNFSDVDGIMLDFIRYADEAVVCYCPYCRAAFESWYYENYGAEVTNWTEFYPNQPKYNIFLEFRPIHLNYLVKDIHDLIKSINPNLVISEAAWTLFSDSAVYQRKWLGQDTAYWIKEGYIDFVAPMMYTRYTTDLENYINTNIKYWMGNAPEGPIPLVAFLRMDFTSNDPTPEQFKALVDLVRSKGLDGWIIWRYVGPGCPIPTPPDIRDYLALIDMPQTFSISNINVETTANSAAITWFTTLPATSNVEYSINPLYNASWETQSGFHYWNVVYAPGIIAENNLNVTEHVITLNDLIPSTTYYFRVQSKSQLGIVTSNTLIFQTKS